jgi:hypothetical protein
MLITALGLGLLFVPMALVSLTKVRNQDTGVASSLVNVGQQVGGSVGLAILGTVAWSTVATSLRSQTAAAAGHPLTAATQTRYNTTPWRRASRTASWSARRSACWR